MANNTQTPQQPNRRPLITIGIVIILGLIALALWQSGSQDSGTASTEPSATPVAAQDQPAASDTSDSKEADAADTSSDSSAPVDTDTPEPSETDTPVSEDTATPEPTETATPEPTETATPEPTDTATPEPPQQVSNLSPIAYEDLPREAQDTIELIDEGGPFPYDKDGTTFQNREGILPDAPEGYYSEYTVITPGSDDRGARRIVAGEDGELYYTDDHYASFEEVIR